jgi:outer membrane protein TolC
MTNRQLLTLVPGFALACAAGPTSALAQTPAGSQAPVYIDVQRGLTIDELVALGLKQSKRLQAARDRSEAARDELDQAARRPNPSAAVLQREQAGGSDRQTTLEVALPLELYRRSARNDVAARATDLAEAELARNEWELATQIRRESLKALTAVRALEVTIQQADAARNLRDLVGASVEAGALPRLDRDMAEVEARRIEATVPLRRAEVDTALLTLKALCGMALDEPLQFRRSLEDEVSATASLTATGLRAAQEPTGRRPDLQLLRGEVALAEAQVFSAQAAGRWDIELMGGYMRTAMSFPQFGFTPDGRPAPISGRFHEVTFGARIMLPVFNANQGATAAATARGHAATAAHAAATLEATAETGAARSRWNALKQSADVYSGGLIALARQNLEVVQQTYLAGRATLNDTLAERRRLLDLEMAYVGIQGDLGMADVELRRALGVMR